MARPAPVVSSSSSSLQLSNLNYYLTDFWAKHGDPKAAHYPMMSTFKIPLAIHFTYYFIVLYLGPRLMRDRKPFSLKWIIIPYNLVLSLFNAYCFVHLLIKTHYGADLFNVNFHESKSPTQMERNIIYTYFISKYVDMLDTVFFIMRKKSNQVTGLHVYHHSMVPLMGWIYFRTKVEHVSAATFAMLNTPVHLIMYAYYGLAAFGPHMQPYLWWKRYITQLQIVQFVFLGLYGIYFAVYNVGYPIFFTYDLFIQTPLYLYLFTSFYLRTYNDAAVQKKAAAAAALKNGIANGNTKKID